MRQGRVTNGTAERVRIGWYDKLPFWIFAVMRRRWLWCRWGERGGGISVEAVLYFFFLYLFSLRLYERMGSGGGGHSHN